MVNSVLTNASGSIVMKRRIQKWTFISGLMKCSHVTKFSPSPKFGPVSFYIMYEDVYLHCNEETHTEVDFQINTKFENTVTVSLT